MSSVAPGLDHGSPAPWWLSLHRALMPDYNRKAALYWWTMVLLGGAVAVLSVLQVAELPRADLLRALGGVAVATLVGLFPVRIPGSKNSFAAGEIYIFLLLAMYGPAAAALAAACEAGLGAYRSSKRWTSRICSPAMAALAMFPCGTLFEWAARSLRTVGLNNAGTFVILLMALGAIYSFANSVLVSTVFKLKRNEALSLLNWFRDWGWVGLAFVATAALAALLFLTFEQFGLAVLIISVPMLAMFLATLHQFFARQELAEREAARNAEHLRELAQSELRFQSAFTHASIGMALVSTDGRVLQGNLALGVLLGRDAAILQDREFRDFVFGDDSGLLQEQLQRIKTREVEAFSLELRSSHSSGREIWISLHCGFFAESASSEPCLIFQVHDITARRRAETRLQHVAYHDSLTNLVNRSRFTECLLQALENQRADPARQFAVMYLDFDRFKLINDSLGHNAGDEFLVMVAHRIQEHMRPSDVVARLGGDEFAILTEHQGNTHHAVALAERLQAVLRKPLQIAGKEITTSASIGITFSDVGYRTPEEVLRDADLAMYKAKAKGRAQYALFDSSLHAQATEQLSLESDLRRALDADELSLAFQPVYQLTPRRIVSFEALIRWHHRERGLISPAMFIPMAEESGLIEAITRWVLRRACAQLRGWHAQYPALADVGVHVNASSKDFASVGFSRFVSDTIEQAGLRPSLLTLEITENALMERAGAAGDTMTQLRELGIGISIDDFGTGYSSLAYLSTLPISSLKIDRSFVRQLQASNENSEIVRAVINLGTSLGKQVIAEGIETSAQLQRLEHLGCSHGQGFLLTEPLAPRQLESLLAGNPAEADSRSPAARTPALDLELLPGREISPALQIH
jgi:diguanylate cyclase (GGDEF)-like protein/PAS domain S-box-containing protein